MILHVSQIPKPTWLSRYIIWKSPITARPLKSIYFLSNAVVVRQADTPLSNNKAFGFLSLVYSLIYILSIQKTKDKSKLRQSAREAIELNSVS